MRVHVVLLLLLLAGCSKPPVTPTSTPSLSVEPGGTYLADPAEHEIQDVYDLLRANFTELNGSVVLSVQLRDVHTPVPRLINAFDVLTSEGRTTFVARTIPDLSRPAPHINYELARIRDGQEERLGTICGIHGAADTPPQVHYDLPHNMTALEQGGSIVRLHVEVRNFENETLYDSADAERTFPVKGGPNPHGECPLVAERKQQS